MRGATLYITVRRTKEIFQSTPPVRGATKLRRGYYCTYEISIHAPRAGGDLALNIFSQERMAFQSTPPVRGATGIPDGVMQHVHDFNPRPPCGGRPDMLVDIPTKDNISIHAPRAGGDRCHGKPCASGLDNFNPRPPCGGRHGNIQQLPRRV